MVTRSWTLGFPEGRVTAINNLGAIVGQTLEDKVYILSNGSLTRSTTTC